MDFELKLIEWLQRTMGSNAMDITSKIFSYFFSYACVALVAIFIFTFYDKKTGIIFSLLQAAAAGIQYLIKLLVARPRPYLEDSLIRDVYHAIGDSYPSGHSVCTMGIVLVICFILREHFGTPKGHITLFSMILYLLMNAFNRMYLGQHYLTDILGGYMLMFGLSWLTLLLFSKTLLNENKKPLIKLRKKDESIQIKPNGIAN